MKEYAHVPGQTIVCHVCHGSGEMGIRNSRSIHTTASPDGLYDYEPCDWCDGSGTEHCGVCGEPASVERGDDLYCGGCWADELRLSEGGVAA